MPEYLQEVPAVGDIVAGLLDAAHINVVKPERPLGERQEGCVRDYQTLSWHPG